MLLRFTAVFVRNLKMIYDPLTSSHISLTDCLCFKPNLKLNIKEGRRGSSKIWFIDSPQSFILKWKLALGSEVECYSPYDYDEVKELEYLVTTVLHWSSIELCKCQWDSRKSGKVMPSAGIPLWIKLENQTNWKAADHKSFLVLLWIDLLAKTSILYLL